MVHPTTFPVVAIAVLTVAGIVAEPAAAHKLEVKATLLPGDSPASCQVEVEAWYEYGDPAEATVTLSGPDGRAIAQAELDPESGKCVLRLPNPTPGSYKVTVDDGAGHHEWVLLPVSADNPAVLAVQSAQRNRWLMAGIGLGLIAGVCLLARRFARTKSASP